MWARKSPLGELSKEKKGSFDLPHQLQMTIDVCIKSGSIVIGYSTPDISLGIQNNPLTH